jgi:hypothetical protein
MVDFLRSIIIATVYGTTVYRTSAGLPSGC